VLFGLLLFFPKNEKPGSAKVGPGSGTLGPRFPLLLLSIGVSHVSELFHYRSAIETEDELIPVFLVNFNSSDPLFRVFLYPALALSTPLSG
jgi:hypothetical protein